MGCLCFAGEVEKVVKDLRIEMKQSPRDLLIGADANEDEVRRFLEGILPGYSVLLYSQYLTSLAQETSEQDGKRPAMHLAAHRCICDICCETQESIV